jgi:hypothetical protein
MQVIVLRLQLLDLLHVRVRSAFLHRGHRLASESLLLGSCLRC